ncbi:MAG: HNH nuclease family protein [Desulfobacterales bacterium]|nr:MAG: HNH nuclease family protein [Desulfobacterales bacterium]
MSTKKKQPDIDRLQRIAAEARRNRELQDQTYRAKALKIYPWICARCGREFSGKRVRELTVHHKDHNHDNNPPDGSNWELLCIYCHDNEHSRDQVAEWYDGSTQGSAQASSLTHRPFAGLEDLLKVKK